MDVKRFQRSENILGCNLQCVRLSLAVRVCNDHRKDSEYEFAPAKEAKSTMSTDNASYSTDKKNEWKLSCYCKISSFCCEPADDSSLLHELQSRAFD